MQYFQSTWPRQYISDAVSQTRFDVNKKNISNFPLPLPSAVSWLVLCSQRKKLKGTGYNSDNLQICASWLTSRALFYRRNVSVRINLQLLYNVAKKQWRISKATHRTGNVSEYLRVLVLCSDWTIIVGKSSALNILKITMWLPANLSHC